MDNRFANQILSQCNGIEYVQERKYWLVRTDGGIHYDDFITNGYIAIGWDYISVDSFNKKTSLKLKLSLQTKNALLQLVMNTTKIRKLADV